MTQRTTTFVDASCLTAGFLSNFPNGTLVLELLSGPVTGGAPPPGIGLRISNADKECIVALTPWSGQNLAAGEIWQVGSTTGIKIAGMALSFEIDFAAPAPRWMARPTGAQAPALTVKDGKPLLLVVDQPSSAANRNFKAFDASGAEVQYFAGDPDKSPIFDKWMLVLSRAEARIEISIG